MEALNLATESGWVDVPTENYGDTLNPGDKLQLHFRALGGTYIKATQGALIERAVKNNELFSIVSTDYWEKGEIVFEVRIRKTNPVVCTVLVITGCILACTAAATLFLVCVKRFIKSPMGTLLGISASVALIAGAIVAVLIFGTKAKQIW